MARRAGLALLLSCALLSATGTPKAAPEKSDRPHPQSSASDAPAQQPGLDPARFGRRVDDAYGAYQRGLYKTAYNLALPRAQNGDPAAQVLLAELLARGLGVPLDARQAAKWYEAAAERGVPEAQFQYALMLLDGNFVPQDKKQAYALMQAAAEAGNALAQFNFAQLLVKENPEDLSLAVDYYERAAEAGVADAQYALAQIYANGVGGRQQDDIKAREWLEKAARQNFDTAQLDLAQWFIEGRGGARDYKQGFSWMQLAANGGNVAAQNRLAKLYVAALGTDPDPVLAAAWYIVARRAGLIDPEMEGYLEGLTKEELQQSVQRANRLP
ncbi:tetratricopeptide repeat protein [Aquamicrobium segne]|uniref:Tetratricopeptide repeat protein n=1 Tax=Aquamicrobium segne TaxID=469547 RepID=A0ABW0H0S9_9HYPH